MPRCLQVWMPECWMENHREQEHTDALRKALKAERVYVVDEMDIHAAKDCDLVFFGSWKYYDMGVDVRRHLPHIPVIHYNWDLYPFQVNAKTDPKTDRTGRARPTPQATRWLEYVEELRLATEVWVPSQGVVRRTHEFCGPEVRCEVVKCNAFPWDLSGLRTDRWQVMGVDLSRPYVVDVLREYTDEPMVGAVARACQAVGIPCIQMDHRLTWDEFRRVVSGAALLVSSYGEASTGGLTLLEGYALGVPVLVSDSLMNGAGEYFGRRAEYFRAGDESALANTIRRLVAETHRTSQAPTLARHWVNREYGVEAFARRLADNFRRVLGCQDREQSVT